MLHRFIPSTLLVAIIISGCAQRPILYAPPTAHVPMFRQAGDVDLSVSLSGVPGGDLRAALSPIDGISLMALGSLFDRRYDSSEHAYHRYLEFGVGMYRELGPSLLGEFAVGYGIGHAVGIGRDFDFGEPQQPAWPASGDYQRIFAQIDLAYTGTPSTSSTADFYGHAFVLRAAHVKFDRIVYADSVNGGNGWFLEPMFVARKGIQAFQAEVQLGLSMSMNDAPFEGLEFFGAVGLRVAMQDLF